MRSEVVSGHIGAYELDGVVGQGGMAVVFAGRESSQSPMCALKVLTGERALESRVQQQFRREVQALAQLNHPAIARVYDFGEVDDSDRMPVGYDLQTGSPWLAMERVEGQRLSAEVIDREWTVLESVILTVLDALAHAHADGILHRDLKPSNILVDTEASTADVRLVDFGITRIYEVGRSVDGDGGDEERLVGTPNYMAPEQIRVQPRRQGPWTDLYAIGAVIWRLVTGAPPFETNASRDTLNSHLEDPLPPFEPTMPVPGGLEGWLRRMLQKAPDQRYRRAADAAWGLLNLGEAITVDSDGDAHVAFGPRRPTLEELEAAKAATLVDDSPATFESPTDGGGEVASAPDPVAAETPPVPEDWRRGATSSRNGAEGRAVIGKRLLGLRRVPMVDRETIRSRLWNRLARVARRGRPEAVVLEGAEGLGKSRLADWCARRAHELGVAHVFKAQYSRGPAANTVDGLGAMLARFFRCVGLTEGAILEELAERKRAPEFDGPTAHHDRIGLAGMMAKTADDEESVQFSGFENRAERHRIAAEAILEIADRRATVVWLDDIHQNSEAVDFCRYV
ncbi:MAG: protein kinase, partial [Bradymonadaceae bacterium]